MRRFVSLRQVSEDLGVCQRTVRRLVQAGRFPRPKVVGRKWLFDEGEVENFVVSQ